MADLVAVAIKPIAPVLDVDWATGAVRTEERRRVRTPADEAACGVALELARAMGAALVVVAAGDLGCDEVLRGVLAEGADRAVRVVVDSDAEVRGPTEQWGSDVVAAALAEVLAAAQVIVCGDASGDRGSATVPARLAHLLSRPQALCLRTVELRDGALVGSRRLDGGRRERLEVVPPCVVSVEPGAAGVPRASLPTLLARSGAAIERVRVAALAGARRGDAPGTEVGPYRPRASDVPAPAERDPIRRAVELAGSLQRSDPPEVLRASPPDAAAAILDRLARWGLR